MRADEDYTTLRRPPSFVPSECPRAWRARESGDLRFRPASDRPFRWTPLRASSETGRPAGKQAASQAGREPNARYVRSRSVDRTNGV